MNQGCVWNIVSENEANLIRHDKPLLLDKFDFIHGFNAYKVLPGKLSSKRESRSVAGMPGTLAKFGDLKRKFT